MSKSVYVGLSGPTYYDYTNRAQLSRNDAGETSPNPILENAFGLAVFYDEIWFLCESLCPQSMRGHPNVRYVDRHFRGPQHQVLRDQIKSILKNDNAVQLPSGNEAIRQNFEHYSDGLLRAGVNWWEQGGLDNHTHRLDIMGISTGANSNRIECLHQDLKIVELLRTSNNIDISLNSFGQTLHQVLLPSQSDPSLTLAQQAHLGAYIINARIDNLVHTSGPDSTVFDKIHENAYVKDFRRFLSHQDIENAGMVYLDVLNEIDNAISEQIRTSAREARPVNGLVKMAIDAALDFLGLGTARTAGKWYLSSIKPSPLGAAAFLLDLEASHRRR